MRGSGPKDLKEHAPIPISTVMTPGESNDFMHPFESAATGSGPAPDGREPAVTLRVMLVAELQDSLLTALHDLHRLEGLITHATDNLMQRFTAADVGLQHAGTEGQEALAEVRRALNSAVTELQFEDMATQLITHTARVLQSCASRLAAEAMACEEDEQPLEPEAPPTRPNPVTQGEMHAGSVELF